MEEIAHSKVMSVSWRLAQSRHWPRARGEVTLAKVVEAMATEEAEERIVGYVETWTIELAGRPRQSASASASQSDER